MKVSLLLLIPWALASDSKGESIVIEHEPNPFKNNMMVHEFIIGRKQTVQELWKSRFAIPILFKFESEKVSTLELSDSFTIEHAKEMNPYLLLPTFQGEQLWNPFADVPVEHYLQSDNAMDMHAISNEIVGAFKEKRPINYVSLAKQFSLLGAVCGMETALKEYAEMMDISVVVKDDLCSAMEKLDGDFKLMAKNVFRHPSLKRGKIITNRISLVALRVPGVLDSAFAGEISKVLSPAFDEQDRMTIFTKYSTGYNSLPNSALFAPLMLEFKDAEDHGNLFKSVPTDIFLAPAFHGRVMEYVNAQLNTWISHEEVVNEMVGSLTCGSVEEIVLRNEMSIVHHGLYQFLIRRYIAMAPKGRTHPLVTWDNLASHSIFLKDAFEAVAKDLVADEQQHFKPSYQGVLNAVGHLGLSALDKVDAHVLRFFCAKHPELLVPEGGPVEVFLKALRSHKYDLAGRIYSLDVIPLTKAVMQEILEISPEQVVTVMKYIPACRQKLFQKHGLKLIDFDGKYWWDRDASVPIQPFSSDDLHQISSNLLVKKAGKAENIFCSNIRNFFHHSCLFDAQMVDYPMSFSFFPQRLYHIPVSSIRRIIYEAPRLREIPWDLLKKYDETKDKHKQVHHKVVLVVFELLPAAMNDDEELAKYLSRLIEFTSNPFSPSWGRFAITHSFQPELKNMQEHLTFVFESRTIRPDLVDTPVGDTFRQLIAEHQVTGTMLNVQLSEGKPDFEQACQLYIQSIGLNRNALDKLLSVLKDNIYKGMLFNAIGEHVKSRVCGNQAEIAKFLLEVIPKHTEAPALTIEAIMRQIEEGNGVVASTGSIEDRLELVASIQHIAQLKLKN